MKYFLLLILLLAHCIHGQGTHANAIIYKAYVQKKIPGNIVSDDIPHPMHPQNIYKRNIYLLLPSLGEVSIDSITYQNIPVPYETEKKTGKTALEVGKMFSDNSAVTLKPTKEKTWWLIELQSSNNELAVTEKLQAALYVYLKVNGVSKTVVINEETELSPQETY